MKVCDLFGELDGHGPARATVRLITYLNQAKGILYVLCAVIHFLLQFDKTSTLSHCSC